MIDEIEIDNAGKLSKIKIEVKSGLTIFVGPNNSGKSAILREIHRDAVASHRRKEPKKSALVKTYIGDFDTKLFEIHPLTRDVLDGELINTNRGTKTKEDFMKDIQDQWRSEIGANFRQQLCTIMGGAQRLSMLPDEHNISLREPGGSLGKLFTDDIRRENFQTSIFKGIGLYPVIDTLTKFGTLRVVFSQDKPNPQEERTLGESFHEFLKRSIDSNDVSDGFKAYVGILGALHATDYKIIMIDEPEAFLHPTLARTLGKQIAVQAKEKSVFSATHSADFLMGAVESGAKIRIIRLRFENDKSISHPIDNCKLKSFMYDPLLRSANVLSGLFARSVIVTEADTDRAFYQEINARLLNEGDHRAIENAIFLNAQNKQTVPRIINMLRRMGVPAAGVLDLDAIIEGGENWKKQVEAIGIPNAMRPGLEVQRASIAKRLKEKGDFKRNGGISVLDPGEKEAAESLISTLASYGLLLVPCGEVEAWLSHLEINRGKQTWLRTIFETMGSEYNSDNYLRPQNGDVWDFIAQCRAWLEDPNRKGMEPASETPDEDELAGVPSS